jgi:Na+-driven multidrug efflux pump
LQFGVVGLWKGMVVGLMMADAIYGWHIAKAKWKSKVAVATHA